VCNSDNTLQPTVQIATGPKAETAHISGYQWRRLSVGHDLQHNETLQRLEGMLPSLKLSLVRPATIYLLCTHKRAGFSCSHHLIHNGNFWKSEERSDEWQWQLMVVRTAQR
jgi:hypothetical protein